MSNQSQSLSSIAIEIVERYQQAAQHLVNAWQAGVERTARSECERFATAVRQNTPLLDDAVRSGLIDARQRASSILVDGVRSGSKALATASERDARTAREGIERIADTVERVDNAFGGKTARTLALLGLPSAQVSLAIANAVAEGAQRLEAGVTGEEGVAQPSAPVRKRKSAAAQA